MFLFFFFNDTATTEIYTLSLHDALPICVGHVLETLRGAGRQHALVVDAESMVRGIFSISQIARQRSEEHTSELQSRSDLVCRLLLEKKKNNYHIDLLLTSPLLPSPSRLP